MRNDRLSEWGTAWLTGRHPSVALPVQPVLLVNLFTFFSRYCVLFSLFGLFTKTTALPLYFFTFYFPFYFRVCSSSSSWHTHTHTYVENFNFACLSLSLSPQRQCQRTRQVSLSWSTWHTWAVSTRLSSPACWSSSPPPRTTPSQYWLRVKHFEWLYRVFLYILSLQHLPACLDVVAADILWALLSAWQIYVAYRPRATASPYLYTLLGAA